jgi:adenylosuccinate lyase
LIARYALAEIQSLFTDENRMAKWLEVELLATQAWADLGVVPAEAAQACRDRAPQVDSAFVAAVNERERVTDHDVAAFVDVVQAAIGGPEGSWIHYGLTSSDVVDTALSSVLADACDLLIEAATGLVEVLRRRAKEHRHTVTVGRTHGIHAEPTTFGNKLALFCLQVDRDRTRLREARRAIAVGKLSGAVGTYSNIDPTVELKVCEALGLVPVPATQVIGRDRHAEVLYACATVGATIEQLSVELRHLQRTELREAEEGFKVGQKGSSAMPHKRNPITAERLSGLARILRGNLVAGLENVALWHERDISHSSVERMILPDSTMLTYYMLRTATKLVDGLQVHTERMRDNFDRSYGLVFSQTVLLALVASGISRDDAYRTVQTAAMRAWDEGRPFRSVLEEIDDLGLSSAQLVEAFSLDRAVRNAGRTVDALDQVT